MARSRRVRAGPLISWRLSLIWVCSFVKSEETNLLEAIEAYPRATYGGGNCVLLLSKRGDQMVFVLGVGEIGGSEVLDSRRLRLRYGDVWSPDMLVNYANQVGIVFDNQSLKRLEETIEEERERKLQAARDARARRIAEAALHQDQGA